MDKQSQKHTDRAEDNDFRTDYTSGVNLPSLSVRSVDTAACFGIFTSGHHFDTSLPIYSDAVIVDSQGGHFAVGEYPLNTNL